MRKALLLIFGVLGVLAGLAALAAGGTVLAMFGRNGTHTNAAGAVRSGPRTAVLVSEISAIGGTLNLDRTRMSITLGARSLAGRQVFIGLAPSQDVEAWLAGVSYDMFEPVGNDTYRIVAVPGSAAASPAWVQTFWVARDQGSDPTIPIDLRGRDLSLVVTNVDGSAPVDVALSLGVVAPQAFPVAVGLLVLGVVLLVVGVVLIILGARTRRGGGAHAGPGVPQPPVPVGMVPPTGAVVMAAPPPDSTGTGDGRPAD